MKYTENALNMMAAGTYRKIGPAWINKYLTGNEDPDWIVSMISHMTEISNEDFEKKKKYFEKKVFPEIEAYCDGVVALGDKDFPGYRGEVGERERPVVLFYKGDLDLLSTTNLNIAVIGLLNPSEEIVDRERRMVDEFVKKGATIVSGLAFGCDSVAHQQALDSQGKTVAILPGPLSQILPARNRGLAYQIVEEGGLLVSEYWSPFKNRMELSSRYKERDRLQALFSDAVVLAASYAKDSAQRRGLYGEKLDSGARLAMEFAKKFGITRAVMYDPDLDDNNSMFDLNRDLKKEQKNIIIIDRDIPEAVKNVLSNAAKLRSNMPIQNRLSF